VSTKKITFKQRSIFISHNSSGQPTNASATAKVLGPGQLAVAFYEGRK